MWRPNKGQWEKVFEQACVNNQLHSNLPTQVAFNTGADAMHLVDIKYLEGHKVLVNLTKEREVSITFKFIKEEWLAFTGKEVI